MHQRSGAGARRLLRDDAGAFGLYGFEIALEDADQIDDGGGALDGAGDRFAAGDVGGDEVELTDGGERLQEEGAARMALGDADPDARLEQRFADVAADESAAAEDRHQRQVACRTWPAAFAPSEPH